MYLRRRRRRPDLQKGRNGKMHILEKKEVEGGNTETRGLIFWGAHLTTHHSPLEFERIVIIDGLPSFSKSVFRQDCFYLRRSRQVIER